MQPEDEVHSALEKDEDSGSPKMKSKQVRRKKPPDAPRRPLSAYNLFFREERARFLAERQEKKQSRNRDPPDRLEQEDDLFVSMGKTIAKRWRELPAEDLERFNKQAVVEQGRYYREKAAYEERFRSKAEAVDGRKCTDTATANFNRCTHPIDEQECALREQGSTQKERMVTKQKPTLKISSSHSPKLKNPPNQSESQPVRSSAHLSAGQNSGKASTLPMSFSSTVEALPVAESSLLVMQSAGDESASASWLSHQPHFPIPQETQMRLLLRRHEEQLERERLDQRNRLIAALIQQQHQEQQGFLQAAQLNSVFLPQLYHSDPITEPPALPHAQRLQRLVPYTDQNDQTFLSNQQNLVPHPGGNQIIVDALMCQMQQHQSQQQQNLLSQFQQQQQQQQQQRDLFSQYLLQQPELAQLVSIGGNRPLQPDSERVNIFDLEQLSRLLSTAAAPSTLFPQAMTFAPGSGSHPDSFRLPWSLPSASLSTYGDTDGQLLGSVIGGSRQEEKEATGVAADESDNTGRSKKRRIGRRCKRN